MKPEELQALSRDYVKQVGGYYATRDLYDRSLRYAHGGKLPPMHTLRPEVVKLLRGDSNQTGGGPYDPTTLLPMYGQFLTAQKNLSLSVTDSTSYTTMMTYMALIYLLTRYAKYVGRDKIDAQGNEIENRFMSPRFWTYFLLFLKNEVVKDITESGDIVRGFARTYNMGYDTAESILRFVVNNYNSAIQIRNRVLTALGRLTSWRQRPSAAAVEPEREERFHTPAGSPMR